MSSPPPTDPVALYRLEGLISDVGEIKVAVKEVSHTLAKISSEMAVMQERQNSDRAEVRRALGELDAVRARLAALERAQPIQQQTTDWVQRFVWAAAAAAVTAIAGGALKQAKAEPEKPPMIIERRSSALAP